MASRSPKARLSVRRLKEHPLAGRRVVRNSDLPNGATVYVVGWAEHASGLPIGEAGQVVVCGEGGTLAISPDDLPSYDLVPVGFVS